MAAPDPSHIMQVATGYGVSRALLSAVGLVPYIRLAEGPMTLGEIIPLERPSSAAIAYT